MPKGQADINFRKMKEMTNKVLVTTFLIFCVLVFFICYFNKGNKSTPKKPRISAFDKIIIEHRRINKLKQHKP